MIKRVLFGRRFREPKKLCFMSVAPYSAESELLPPVQSIYLILYGVGWLCVLNELQIT